MIDGKYRGKIHIPDKYLDDETVLMSLSMNVDIELAKEQRNFNFLAIPREMIKNTEWWSRYRIIQVRE